METRLPKRVKGVTPAIPKGWKLYTEPMDWKFVVGAKFWGGHPARWMRVRAFGAHAIPYTWMIVPESGLAFWFCRFMKWFL